MNVFISQSNVILLISAMIPCRILQKNSLSERLWWHSERNYKVVCIISPINIFIWIIRDFNFSLSLSSYTKLYTEIPSKLFLCVLLFLIQIIEIFSFYIYVCMPKANLKGTLIKKWFRFHIMFMKWNSFSHPKYTLFPSKIQQRIFIYINIKWTFDKTSHFTKILFKCKYYNETVKWPWQQVLDFWKCIVFFSLPSPFNKSIKSTF